GAAQFVQGKYDEAEKNYLQSLQDVSLNVSSILKNPTLEEITLINTNEFIHVYLNNKTEYLLSRYRQTKDPTFLKACLQTALLTDSVIKFIRREHTGEQSKLFWRNRTREFFTNALDACFLSNDPKLAFYFMESSRAVILADKINELGASSFLPLAETLQEQKFREAVIIEQQDLSSTKQGTEEYRQSTYRLLQKKEQLDRFLQSLEKNYPAYYQYKYSEVVPTLAELQTYLSANRQSFVHYFIGDTVSFALGITTGNVEMVRIPKDRFQPKEIKTFFSFLPNKQMLNAESGRFSTLSHRLYKTLFEPLKLPKGRVVICPDNFLLPFEALSADATGKKMLIEDYAFSYIYSARYLLKQFPEYPAKGNFLGFAPVSFQSHLHVADLQNSAVSLRDASDNYNNVKMYTAAQATKRNFLANIGLYNIVNIFSHARADDTDTEPILYMQDSTISLSELQYVSRPHTKLVVLSACQTTAGKNATGEGIYSLARGFASAGIPSVAATMWKADEETIYAISKYFHQYLSQGMAKDEALQKAKIQFINNANREHSLPYYWSNMIIIGQVKAIALTEKQFPWMTVVLIAGALLLLAGIVYWVRR
ncbi:MAG TPA: CHAT domain-containing protein, partial [Flavitalea sp.]|nr:CHAT domain-containing protein [Flavitalea sp.]